MCITHINVSCTNVCHSYKCVMSHSYETHQSDIGRTYERAINIYETCDIEVMHTSTGLTVIVDRCIRVMSVACMNKRLSPSWANTPSTKGTKLLLEVIKAIVIIHMTHAILKSSSYKDTYDSGTHQRTIDIYRVAKPHRVPYLYGSFSANKSYIHSQVLSLAYTHRPNSHSRQMPQRTFPLH